MMRLVVIVVAALLTLGLAAFGIVATQNAAGPGSLVALAARVVSPTQTAAPAPTAQMAPMRVVQAPVTQLSDATAAPPPAAPSAPTVLAQNTTPLAIPASAPAPSPAPPAPST